MNIPEHDSEVQELIEEEIVDTSNNHELIVFNDDVNTFEHVINTLVDICDHSLEQAEQCTWIIHYKGKCAVKLGPYQKLTPMKKAICDKGIFAEVF